MPRSHHRQKYNRATFKAKKKKKGRVCAFITLSYFFPYFTKPKKVKVQGRLEYCNNSKDESNIIFGIVENKDDTFLLVFITGHIFDILQ